MSCSRKRNVSAALNLKNEISPVRPSKMVYQLGRAMAMIENSQELEPKTIPSNRIEGFDGETLHALSRYSFNDQEWEAIKIASWLHDCGKVTTPEFVVDKATKLEPIYDHIHEIRMRFEVLKRDAHISYWQKIADGGDREVFCNSSKPNGRNWMKNLVLSLSAT